MKKLLILLVIFLSTTSQCFASFSYVKSITVDKTKVGGLVATPTGFAVLVDDTDVDLKPIDRFRQRLQSDFLVD